MLRVEARLPLDGLELDAELEVAEGRTLAVAGPSGAGKTTLLRIVAGLTRPATGRVACGDEVWLDTGRGIDRPPERRRCGYVFQDYAIFEHLRVWRNVAYGVRGAPRRQRRDRAAALLARFGIEHLAGRWPRSLSGGERQRVALARALASRPNALVLDEPLSALDARTRAQAARELATVLGDVAVPTLLVTHDFSEAAALGDEVAVLDAGRIAQRGAAGELAARPATAFVADFVGGIVLTGRARPGPDGTTVVELDGGGAVTCLEPGSGPVAVTVYPWEIALAPVHEQAAGSARNRLEAEVVSVTALGNRLRVGLAGGQPLVAELTEAAARELALAPGVRVAASWKATATRLVQR